MLQRRSLGATTDRLVLRSTVRELHLAVECCSFAAPYARLGKIIDLMRPIRAIAKDRLGLARTRYRSFAQSGEDRIASHVLNEMGVLSPRYLDLGAHHPVKFSNTYLFYRRGGRGVCVEPDPHLAMLIKRRRFRDMCLNVAVAPSDGTLQFHVMRVETLSTTSPGAVARLKEMGHEIERTIEVEAISPKTILSRHFDATPNLVSLDVEGSDLEILQSWDFTVHRPQVFIVETVEYAEDGMGAKMPGIAELMESVGYFPYADTFINTIFVDRSAPTARRG